MDPRSPLTPEPTSFSNVHSHVNSDVVADFSISPAACNLCGTILSSANEATADFEAMGLCGDCKFLLLEDFGNRQRNSHRRRSVRRRVRTRNSSSESIEDLFTQQFTRMINVARQSLSPAPGGDDDQSSDGYAAVRLMGRSSSRITPSNSRRWRTVLSDSESEDFDHLGSRFGESDSNASFSQYRFLHGDGDTVSFSAYEEESDAASVDVHDLLDPGSFIQPDERSNLDNETDIDPMHAGLNTWDSDDQEDEDDGEWEEADPDEDAPASRTPRTRFNNYLTSPSESIGSVSRSLSFNSPDFEDMLRLRIRRRGQLLPRNILTSLDDYIDDIGFEAMLEHLAGTDDTRRGAPPTAESFIKNLPRVIINQEHLENDDGLACAICKDLLTTGTVVNQLPCLHLYHPKCILPWLNARNSCPICRYELPTDDKDYEECKRHSENGIEIHGIADRAASDEDSSDNDDDVSVTNQIITESDRHEGVESRGRGIWFFLAAAPVVSLVGIALAVWFSNPQRPDLAVPRNFRQIQNQRGGDRARRWWPFF